MKLDPPKLHDRTSWLRTCIGATLLFGILVTRPEDAEQNRASGFSLPGSRFGTDLLLALGTLLLVSGGSRMVVSAPPKRLMLFGAVLFAMGFIGPIGGTLLIENAQTSIFILPVIVLEFAGAAFFAAGVRRLIRR